MELSLHQLSYTEQSLIDKYSIFSKLVGHMEKKAFLIVSLGLGPYKQSTDKLQTPLKVLPAYAFSKPEQKSV